MKLESFLQESIESSKAWGTISQFDVEHQEMFKKIGNTLKGFRMSEGTYENPEDSHDGRGRIEFDFTDGLVDLALKASTSEDDGKITFSFLMVTAKVQQKYMLDVKDNKSDITYFAAFSKGDSGFDEKLETFKKAVDDFVEWYFDMSGQYGKIKLFKTHYNVIEGYHDSNQPRFIAIAGDFMCSSEVSDVKPMKVEPRVL